MPDQQSGDDRDQQGRGDRHMRTLRRARRTGRTLEARKIRAVAQTRMVGAHRPLDVFHRLLAHELVLERQLVTDRRVNRLGDADTARLGETLEPGGHVDAVTVDVVAVDDHLAEIDPDTELNRLPVDLRRVLPRERLLDVCGTDERLGDGGKLGEHGIAGVVDDLTVTRFDGCGDEVEKGAQAPVSALLVLTGEAAVARHVRVQDSRELSR